MLSLVWVSKIDGIDDGGMDLIIGVKVKQSIAIHGHVRGVAGWRERNG